MALQNKSSVFETTYPVKVYTRLSRISVLEKNILFLLKNTAIQPWRITAFLARIDFVGTKSVISII